VRKDKGSGMLQMMDDGMMGMMWLLWLVGIALVVLVVVVIWRVMKGGSGKL
jgi:hypothetical protein